MSGVGLTILSGVYNIKWGLQYKVGFKILQLQYIRILSNQTDCFVPKNYIYKYTLTKHITLVHIYTQDKRSPYVRCTINTYMYCICITHLNYIYMVHSAHVILTLKLKSYTVYSMDYLCTCKEQNVQLQVSVEYLQCAMLLRTHSHSITS